MSDRTPTVDAGEVTAWSEDDVETLGRLLYENSPRLMSWDEASQRSREVYLRYARMSFETIGMRIETRERRWIADFIPMVERVQDERDEARAEVENLRATLRKMAEAQP